MEITVKLDIKDVDFFCRDVNTFKSNVWIIEESKTINSKSLLSLLTADFSKPLTVVLTSEDKYELDAFKDLERRYGGNI